jgi:hypothetical protein
VKVGKIPFASLKQPSPRNSDGGDIPNEDVMPIAQRDSGSTAVEQIVPNLEPTLRQLHAAIGVSHEAGAESTASLLAECRLADSVDPHSGRVNV